MTAKDKFDILALFMLLFIGGMALIIITGVL